MRGGEDVEPRPPPIYLTRMTRSCHICDLIYALCHRSMLLTRSLQPATSAGGERRKQVEISAYGTKGGLKWTAKR